MKTIKRIGALAVCALAALPSLAQQTYQEMEQLTINENVTTVITASEPVRFVDISTDAVVGDQPINNTIRLKPKEGADVHADGDILAIVTIVTERYRTQYALIYTTRLQEAVTDKQIQPHEKIPYHNPSVSMSTEDMTKYAKDMELPGKNTECEHTSASDDHAPEQYLFRRRILLPGFQH